MPYCCITISLIRQGLLGRLYITLSVMYLHTVTTWPVDSFLVQLGTSGQIFWVSIESCVLLNYWHLRLRAFCTTWPAGNQATQPTLAFRLDCPAWRVGPDVVVLYRVQYTTQLLVP